MQMTSCWYLQMVMKSKWKQKRKTWMSSSFISMFLNRGKIKGWEQQFPWPVNAAIMWINNQETTSHCYSWKSSEVKLLWWWGSHVHLFSDGESRLKNLAYCLDMFILQGNIIQFILLSSWISVNLKPHSQQLLCALLRWTGLVGQIKWGPTRP